MQTIHSDEALARAAAAGDQAAFAVLYERYERRLFTYCRRVVGRDEDAADAVQDSFVKLLRKLPERSEGIENFAAFVFTVARNACYDLLRTRQRIDPVEDVPEPAEALDRGSASTFMVDPERRALTEAMRDEVAAASDRLPARHREVLVLREVEELSYEQIAELLGIKRNAVSQLILRARNGLSRELRRGTLAGLASPATADCGRALKLITMRQDEEPLDALDVGFLDGHVVACTDCRFASETLAEAGATYRALAPPLIMIAGLREAVTGAVSQAFGFGWASGGTAATTATVAASGSVLTKVAAIAATIAVAGGGAAVVASRGADAPAPPAAAAQPISAAPIAATPTATPTATPAPEKKKTRKRRPKKKKPSPTPTPARPAATSAPAPIATSALAPKPPADTPEFELEVNP